MTLRACVLALVAVITVSGETGAVPMGQNAPLLDASSITITAPNGSPTKFSAWASETVNVKLMGAKGDGVTDDTAAFATSIASVNSAAASGAPTCLYIPPGVYYINGPMLPQFTNNTGGGVCGAGSWKSIIVLGSSYSGSLFSWADGWMAGVYNTGGGTGTSIVKPQNIGARVVGLSILGTNLASAEQDALVFYDHNDFVTINDVDVENLNGRAFYAGIIKNDTDAYMRESHISNLRIFNSGIASSIPAFELTTQCNSNCSGADAANSIDISSVDIYGPRGPGFVIRNAAPATGGAIRAIHISKLRVEGTEGNTYSVAADLVKIGDASMSGPLTEVTCVDCAFTSPYAGYFALNINGATASTAPNRIQFNDLVVSAGGGAGGGLNIGAGGNIDMDILSLSSAQTNVAIASSTTTFGPIILAGHGAESSWTWSIDATALQYVSNGAGVFGNPVWNNSQHFFSLLRPDGTVGGGNNRGMYSVDMQHQHTSATQVASGAGSAISGGQQNTASNTGGVVAGGLSNINGAWYGVVGGGSGNTLTGGWSVVPGGWQASDYGLTGIMAYANGQIAVVGDNELTFSIMRASTNSTTATRLSTTGGAATNTNVWNIPINSSLMGDIRCVYKDTTAQKTQTWEFPGVLISKGASASTTIVVATTAVNGQNVGAPGASAPTITADTTYGGVNISFTAPNADLSHIACGISGVTVF